MEMYTWSLIIILSKAIFYAGLASIAGCTFLCLPLALSNSAKNRYMCQLQQRVVPLLILVQIAVPVWFIAKTGAFSESGLLGAVDPFMLEVIWDSPIGDVALVRLLSISIAILTLLLFLKAKINSVVMRTFLLLSLGIGIYSFMLMGHVSEKTIFEKLILSFHVAIMAWWFGSLMPLKLVTEHFPLHQAQKVMLSFGKKAEYLVFVLILLGFYMFLDIFTKWEQIFNTNYGIAFLTKLTIVCLLLLVAARHKFFLVPKLSNQKELKKLERSINIEIVLASFLFIVTAGITSVVGPDFS